MDAQGALDSLLGRLTTILVDEAQLLGRVRGDVEFIKEEMECMNSLILQITEAQHRDHLVRAWMKQVIGLTRDCEGNVGHYIHYVSSSPGDDGFLRYLHRILRFVRTIPVRHRIARRIRELKVRARDVGDRRQRYGVTVPHTEPHQSGVVGTCCMPGVPPQPGGPEEEEDFRRRELLYGQPPDTIDEGTERVLGWLSEQLKAINKDVEAQDRIRIFITGGSGAGKTAIARTVYQHPSVVSSFKHRAWVSIGGSDRDLDEIVYDILEQIPIPLDMATLTNEKREARGVRLENLLRDNLDGKMCLIFLDDVPEYVGYLKNICSLFENCASGSTVICTGYCNPEGNIFRGWGTRKYEFSVIKEQGTRPWFFRRRAFALSNKIEPVEKVLGRCYSDPFALQMLLHLLYVNPNLSVEDELLSSLHRNKENIAKGMLMFSYNQLPINYKSCLLYLSIFPLDHLIRRTSLLRRWIAEGLIAERSAATEKNNKARHGISMLQDQAEHR